MSKAKRATSCLGYYAALSMWRSGLSILILVLFDSVCLSVSQSVCLSICLSVCLSHFAYPLSLYTHKTQRHINVCDCVCISMFINIYLYPSALISISLTISIHVSVSFYISVSLSTSSCCLSNCVSVSLLSFSLFLIFDVLDKLGWAFILLAVDR